MAKYSFIDASNTIGTTKNLLFFEVDWLRLCKFLKNKKWNCKEVFIYKGHKGNKEKEQLEKLQKEVGCVVRTKLTHFHKGVIKEVKINCDKCENVLSYRNDIGGQRKSNCDVELTVDAIEILSEGDEAIILTGDGDFAYLIEKLISKGVIVWIVSNQKRDCYGNKRFSTRLRKIIKKEGEKNKRARYIDIDSWRENIKKRKPPIN
jgi:uncharacterized LabA/DUF88 family protein